MVTDSLREAILNGSLKPGQRLMDAEIAVQLGVSRSPVREALRQLEKDGLVYSIPNRGAMVTDLSEEDLDQLYGIRAVLEGLAAVRAVQYIEEAEMGELWRLCREMQGLLPIETDEHRVEFLRRDAEFHELLVSAGRSRVLAEMLSSIRLRIRMIMAAISAATRASAQAASEHVLLLEAIERKDADMAERLARSHVLESMRRMLRLIHAEEM